MYLVGNAAAVIAINRRLLLRLAPCSVDCFHGSESLLHGGIIRSSILTGQDYFTPAVEQDIVIELWSQNSVGCNNINKFRAQLAPCFINIFIGHIGRANVPLQEKP
jgi:hypothetical protein